MTEIPSSLPKLSTGVGVRGTASPGAPRGASADEGDFESCVKEVRVETRLRSLVCRKKPLSSQHVLACSDSETSCGGYGDHRNPQLALRLWVTLDFLDRISIAEVL